MSEGEDRRQERLQVFKSLRHYDLSYCGHCVNRIERAPGVWAMWFEGSHIDVDFGGQYRGHGNIFDHLMYDYYWFSAQPYGFSIEQLPKLRSQARMFGVGLYDIVPGSHAEGAVCLIFVIEELQRFKETVNFSLDSHTRYEAFVRIPMPVDVPFDKGGVRRSLQKSYVSIPVSNEILQMAIKKLWPKGRNPQRRDE